jgi:ABC-type branched-subunit amino acid transport system permease subunit
VAYLLARTSIGKSMRAVSDNRDLAAISGIDVDRIGTYVWILAGALAGLGGVMFAMIQGTFDPNLGYQILFLILTSVVLGGIGNAYGALVAGVVLGMVMELSTWSGLAGGLDARMKPVLAFAALIGSALAAAGTLRQGKGALNVDFLNPAFWTFVAVIAGIYAIMALGLYVQFSLAGLPISVMSRSWRRRRTSWRSSSSVITFPFRWRRWPPSARRSPSACCSPARRCGCAPIIWRSRPSPEARSSAISR